jgi:hypothetical protein
MTKHIESPGGGYACCALGTALKPLPEGDVILPRDRKAEADCTNCIDYNTGYEAAMAQEAERQ